MPDERLWEQKKLAGDMREQEDVRRERAKPKLNKKRGETRPQFIHLRETARWDLRGGKSVSKILTLKGRIGLDDL
jgi:hypothetical protein